MSALKRYILNKIRIHLLGKIRYQRLFNALKVLSIQGLNYGDGGSVEMSGETWLLEQLAKKFTEDHTYFIFDVGANEGGYLYYLTKYLPGENVKIWCFEPSLSTYKLLTTKYGSKGNVSFQNLGFSNSSGKVQLFTSQAGTDIASLFPLERAAGTTQPLSDFETVEIKTIDEFLAEENIPHIDFLKLDIEGNEFNALLGATAAIKTGKIKAIQFEFGTCNIDSRTFFRDFWNLLSPKYHIYRIVKDGLSPIISYIEYEEVFNTINYYAELK